MISVVQLLYYRHNTWMYLREIGVDQIKENFVQANAFAMIRHACSEYTFFVYRCNQDHTD